MKTNKFVFNHPTRCLIYGPSCSGKTVFVQRVIANRDKLFTIIPKRVIYTYVYEQPWFSAFPEVEFAKEIPNNLEPSLPSMLILDDLISDSNVLKECAALFIRGSHHLNVSVFFVTQNLFASSNYYRTISLNATQFVLFRTKRGYSQIEYLGRQIFERRQIKHFLKAYRDSTKEPYSYLIVDLDVNQEHPLRTKIFPNETEIVYVLE